MPKWRVNMNQIMYKIDISYQSKTTKKISTEITNRNVFTVERTTKYIRNSVWLLANVNSSDLHRTTLPFICSASSSVSGNLRLRVSGKWRINTPAMNAIAPNIKYGKISRYWLWQSSERKIIVQHPLIHFEYKLILTRSGANGANMAPRRPAVEHRPIMLWRKFVGHSSLENGINHKLGNGNLNVGETNLVYT